MGKYIFDHFAVIDIDVCFHVMVPFCLLFTKFRILFNIVLDSLMGCDLGNICAKAER
jgi:hypothetical protein